MSTKIQHHLGDEILLGYASGSLSEGWSLAVATHLALCPECRKRLATAEAVGGAMFEAVEPAAVADDTLESVLARLDDLPPEKPIAKPAHGNSETGAQLFPEPLRSYVGSQLNWKWLGSAQQIRIKTGDKTTSCRLLRIPAGQPMPTHGHRGLELTLVLQGSFHDEDGTFHRGDIEAADEGVEHQPIAGEGEDCICLAVTDAPLRLHGVAAILQPFLRI